MREYLLRACKLLTKRNISASLEPVHILSNVKSNRWLVSERFKLIACKVPKVGSTNIARLLYALDHIAQINDSNRVRKGQARHQAILKMDNKNITSLVTYITRTYTKFMFVRDPLERLLSAYRDRRPRSWFKTNPVTFSNFLENILDTSDDDLNIHHYPFYKMCRPCLMKYDFIGLLSEFEGTMRMILQKAGAEKAVNVILPSRNKTGYQERTSLLLQNYLRNVSKTIIERIYQRYYLDYYLFGFRKPKF